MSNGPYVQAALSEREGFAHGYCCDEIDAQWYIRTDLQSYRDMLAKSRIRQPDFECTQRTFAMLEGVQSVLGVNKGCGLLTEAETAEARANAVLRKAAPELLARLKSSTKSLIAERDCLYESITDCDGNITDPPDGNALIEFDLLIDANINVIAKATSEGLS